MSSHLSGQLQITGPAGTTGPFDVDTSTITNFRNAKVARVAIAGGTDTGGGLGSWQNPEGASIMITRVLLDVTAAATAACSAEIGTTATNATTASANLIDTLDVHTATGLFDNITDKGTNGKSRQLLAAGKWVTFSTISGASAGLAGVAYIEYIVV